MPLEGQRIAELLLEHVADHPLRLGDENVERIGVDGRVGRALQREQADLRAVAVGDDQLVVGRHRGERLARRAGVLTLVLGGQRLPAPQQRVASEGDDDAHAQLPSVATMTALIVCMRFSASSKTIDASDSKTSSVTSSAVRPNFSCSCLPTCVSALWKAGRQCMNFTSGLPVAAIVCALIW